MCKDTETHHIFVLIWEPTHHRPQAHLGIPIYPKLPSQSELNKDTYFPESILAVPRGLDRGPRVSAFRVRDERPGEVLLPSCQLSIRMARMQMSVILLRRKKRIFEMSTQRQRFSGNMNSEESEMWLMCDQIKHSSLSKGRQVLASTT